MISIMRSDDKDSRTARHQTSLHDSKKRNADPAYQKWYSRRAGLIYGGQRHKMLDLIEKKYEAKYGPKGSEPNDKMWENARKTCQVYRDTAIPINVEEFLKTIKHDESLVNGIPAEDIMEILSYNAPKDNEYIEEIKVLKDLWVAKKLEYSHALKERITRYGKGSRQVSDLVKKCKAELSLRTRGIRELENDLEEHRRDSPEDCLTWLQKGGKQKSVRRAKPSAYRRRVRGAPNSVHDAKLLLEAAEVMKGSLSNNSGSGSDNGRSGSNGNGI